MRPRYRRWLLLAVPLLLLAAAGWRVYAGFTQLRLDRELVSAAYAGNTRRIVALIDQGADPNASLPSGGLSLWRRLVDPLLGRKRPAGTPAIAACLRDGNWEALEALAQHGANPNVRTKSGSTPLIEAARWGPTSSVRALLAAGADTRPLDKYGETALSATVTDYPAGSCGPKVALLLRHGADPSDGRALPQALLRRNYRAAEVLLKRGADPNRNVCSYMPMPCLAYTAFAGNSRMVGVLLRCGADPTAPAFPGHPWTTAQIVTDPALRRLLSRGEADWRRKHPKANH